jgi:hypothetical protein
MFSGSAENMFDGAVEALISRTNSGGMHYDVDFSRAHLVMPSIGWSKPINVPAALRFDVSSKDNGYKVENLERVEAGFVSPNNPRLDGLILSGLNAAIVQELAQITSKQVIGEDTTPTEIRTALASDNEISANSDMHFYKAQTGGGCSSCFWIVAEGIIKDHTPKDFEDFLSKNDDPHLREIHLNSLGGLVRPAMKFGQSIRDHNLNTRVAKTYGQFDVNSSNVLADKTPNNGDAGVCASACVLAFMGGVFRAAVSDSYAIGVVGKLGVHQFQADIKSGINIDSSQLNDILSKTEQLNSDMIEYVKKMGVDPEILSIAGRTLEVRWLTDNELRQTKMEAAEPK